MCGSQWNCLWNEWWIFLSFASVDNFNTTGRGQYTFVMFKNTSGSCLKRDGVACKVFFIRKETKNWPKSFMSILVPMLDFMQKDDSFLMLTEYLYYTQCFITLMFFMPGSFSWWMLLDALEHYASQISLYLMMSKSDHTTTQLHLTQQNDFPLLA